MGSLLRITRRGSQPATHSPRCPFMIPLADLLTDPGRVQELPPGFIPARMAQCAALQAALAAVPWRRYLP